MAMGFAQSLVLQAEPTPPNPRGGGGGVGGGVIRPGRAWPGDEKTFGGH